MELVARSKPLEARHFGYGVLQHVVAKRWREFSSDEKTQLAKMCYEKLSEISSSSDDGTPGLPQTAEPFVLKSKVASLMAQVVRQQGADVWIALVPDLALGAASENPALAEVSCLTTRYVAEDVAVHNEDIIGGRMKELLFGLTSTLPQTLPALYRSLEVRMRQSSSRLFFSRLDFFFSVRSRPSARPRVAYDETTFKDQPSEHPSCGLLFNSLAEATRARGRESGRVSLSATLRSALDVFFFQPHSVVFFQSDSGCRVPTTDAFFPTTTDPLRRGHALRRGRQRRGRQGALRRGLRGAGRRRDVRRVGAAGAAVSLRSPGRVRPLSERGGVPRAGVRGFKARRAQAARRRGEQRAERDSR
jgi:hypothetical protein